MSESALNVSVISPVKELYTGEADYVKVPGVAGSFGILKNHAPLVAQLDIGILEVKKASETFKMVIDGGFIEVQANKINVLANGGALATDLKEEELSNQLKEVSSSSAKNKNIETKKLKTRLKLLGK